MKVIFLLDRLNLGGAERHSLQLAKALSARGHEVTTIVLFSGSSEKFPADEFPTKPLFLNAKSIISARLIRDLRDAINETGPDFVFSINQTALVAASLARHFGANIPHLSCRFATTVISSFTGRMKLPIFKFFAARADTLIFVSFRQREYWERRGLTAKRVVCVQNGINTRRFVPATIESRNRKRSEYGIKAEEIALTLVGRLSVEKNHSWLIKILAELLMEFPEKFNNMKILLIGEGPERANLEMLAKTVNLSERIVFAGGKRDVAPELAAADIGILVSNAVETFSHAALELMCTAVPMIMTDIGGASEIVVDGDNGFLVNLDDSSKLKSALNELLDEDKRRIMGDRARRHVLEHFTHEKMVDRYEQLLKFRSL